MALIHVQFSYLFFCVGGGLSQQNLSIDKRSNLTLKYRLYIKGATIFDINQMYAFFIKIWRDQTVLIREIVILVS